MLSTGTGVGVGVGGAGAPPDTDARSSSKPNKGRALPTFTLVENNVVDVPWITTKLEAVKRFGNYTDVDMVDILTNSLPREVSNLWSASPTRTMAREQGRPIMLAEMLDWLLEQYGRERTPYSLATTILNDPGLRLNTQGLATWSSYVRRFFGLLPAGAISEPFYVDLLQGMLPDYLRTELRRSRPTSIASLVRCVRDVFSELPADQLRLLQPTLPAAPMSTSIPSVPPRVANVRSSSSHSRPLPANGQAPGGHKGGGSASSSTTCYFCGRLGHVERDCRRKADISQQLRNEKGHTSAKTVKFVKTISFAGAPVLRVSSTPDAVTSTTRDDLIQSDAAARAFAEHLVSDVDLLVPVNLDGYSREALVDRGSAVSCVSSQWCAPDPALRALCPALAGPDGAPLKAMGLVKRGLTIATLDPSPCERIFVVVEGLASDVLLGRDTVSADAYKILEDQAATARAADSQPFTEQAVDDYVEQLRQNFPSDPKFDLELRELRIAARNRVTAAKRPRYGSDVHVWQSAEPSSSEPRWRLRTISSISNSAVPTPPPPTSLPPHPIYPIPVASVCGEDAPPVLLNSDIVQTAISSSYPEGANLPPVSFELVPNARPTIMSPVRQAPLLQEKLRREVDEHLAAGRVFQLSRSELSWLSPAFMVAKGSDHRGVYAFLKLNKAIKADDSYPLPRVDHLFQSLHGCGLFSIIDLKFGFNQIALDEDVQRLTAFSTPFGFFAWRRLPLGLRIAPQAFQRLLDNVFEGLPEVRVYIDDVLIATPNTLEGRARHLEVILEVCRRLVHFRLAVSPRKVHLWQKSIDYLGCTIKENALLISAKRLTAVSECKAPSTVKALRALIGFFSYLRQFIPHFTELVAPLHDLLLTSDKKLLWSAMHDDALNALKVTVARKAVLALPDFDAPFDLTTDASDVGVGAELAQGGRPVGYYSARLNPAQRAYSATDRELLAVVEGIRHFRDFLSLPFTVFSDHANLQALDTAIPDPHRRHARWSEFLADFSFTIVHTPGVSIPHVDYLSRYPLDNVLVNSLSVSSSEHSVLTPVDISVPPIQGFPSFPLFTFDELRKRQTGEDFDRLAATLSDSLVTIGGIHYAPTSSGKPGARKPILLPVIPTPSVEEVLDWHLAFGHAGVQSLIKRTNSAVITVGLRQVAEAALATCNLCRVYRFRSARPPPTFSFSTARVAPFAELAVDLLGPLSASREGYTSILSAVDTFSGFLFTIPLRDTSAHSLILALFSNVFFKFGFPSQLRSDNGSNLRSSLLREVAAACRIKHSFVLPYHPSANGQIERLNSVITKGLSLLTEKWSAVSLAALTYAYNAAPRRDFSMSPFAILFGGRQPEHVLPPVGDAAAQAENLMPALFQTWREVIHLAAGDINDSLELRRTALKKKSKNAFTPEVGDAVFFLDLAVAAGFDKLSRHKRWVPATVVSRPSTTAFIVERIAPVAGRDTQLKVDSSRLIARATHSPRDKQATFESSGAQVSNSQSHVQTGLMEHNDWQEWLPSPGDLDLHSWLSESNIAAVEQDSLVPSTESLESPWWQVPEMELDSSPTWFDKPDRPTPARDCTTLDSSSFDVKDTSDFMSHSFVCAKCGQPGELLVCSHCPRAYHASCLGVMTDSVGDDWSCPEHVATSRTRSGRSSRRPATLSRVSAQLGSMGFYSKKERGECGVVSAHTASSTDVLGYSSVGVTHWLDDTSSVPMEYLPTNVYGLCL